MATEYKMDFTDANTLRTFELREFTTNGPKNPHTTDLDSKATAAASTLLLYGKGSPDYGERVQENMLHMLENFAADEEPVYPVSGQLWYDRSQDPDHLRVFDAFKFQIINDPNNPLDNRWIAIQTTTNAEETEMNSLFLSNPALRLRRLSTGEIASETAGSVIIRSGNIVAVQLAATPSTAYASGDWYIGGWEFLLQNNAPLYEDFYANPTGGTRSWTFKNLANPVDDYDAATVLWVNSAIASAIDTVNQLGEMGDVVNDVTSTGISGQVLRFNGTSWENDDLDDIYLPLSGGTMTGNINMNNAYRVQFMLDPVLGKDAVTLDYLNNEFASFTTTFSISLDDLSDVLLPSGTVTESNVLQFTGGVWRNVDITDFITNHSLAQTTGTIFTGAVTIPNTTVSDPGTRAASKSYVDSEISSAIGAASDYYTYDAQFTGGLLTILTTNPAVGVAGNITVDISSASGGNTSIMEHTADDPSDGLFGGANGLQGHRQFHAIPTYPNIPLNDYLHDVSRALGVYNSPRQRFAFPAIGSGRSVVYLGDTSGGLQGDQCNPIADIGMAYIKGFNGLQVYVNGVRQVISEHRFLEFDVENTALPGSEQLLYEGELSYLTSGNIYSFTVTSDTSGPNVVIIRDDQGGAAPYDDIPFDNFEYWGRIIEQINVQADNFGWGFGAAFVDGLFVLYSNTAGTGSTLSVTDGGGGNTAFFANVGTTAIANRQYDFQLTGSTPDTSTNFYAPTNYGIIELAPSTSPSAGRVGQRSDKFEISPAPPAGAIVEVLIEHEMFGDILPP